MPQLIACLPGRVGVRVEALHDRVEAERSSGLREEVLKARLLRASDLQATRMEMSELQW